MHGLMLDMFCVHICCESISLGQHVHWPTRWDTKDSSHAWLVLCAHLLWVNFIVSQFHSDPWTYFLGGQTACSAVIVSLRPFTVSVAKQTTQTWTTLTKNIQHQLKQGRPARPPSTAPSSLWARASVARRLFCHGSRSKKQSKQSKQSKKQAAKQSKQKKQIRPPGVY